MIFFSDREKALGTGRLLTPLYYVLNVKAEALLRYGDDAGICDSSYTWFVYVGI